MFRVQQVGRAASLTTTFCDGTIRNAIVTASNIFLNAKMYLFTNTFELFKHQDTTSKQCKTGNESFPCGHSTNISIGTHFNSEPITSQSPGRQTPTSVQSSTALLCAAAGHIRGRQGVLPLVHGRLGGDPHALGSVARRPAREAGAGLEPCGPPSRQV